MSQSNKKITILGIGGHGWKSLSKFLSQPNLEFKIYNLPADWGNSTGMWGRMLDLYDGRLNKVLHLQKQANFPWGDYSKLLQYFLYQKYGSKVSSILNFRSYHLDKLESEFELLFDYLALTLEDSKIFKTYLETSIAFLTHYNSEFDVIVPLALANPILSFLLAREGSISKINEFWGVRDIIPSNIYYDFSHLNRVEIEAKTNIGSLIIGEHNIDTAKDLLIPNSLKLTPRLPSTINPKLIPDILESDLIVIPNGSIANWLPLINIPEVLETLLNKDMAWLLNPTRTPNEAEADLYLKYLSNHKLKPKILGLVDLPDKTKLAENLKPNKFSKHKLPNFTALHKSQLEDSQTHLDPEEINTQLMKILDS